MVKTFHTIYEGLMSNYEILHIIEDSHLFFNIIHSIILKFEKHFYIIRFSERLSTWVLRPDLVEYQVTDKS